MRSCRHKTFAVAVTLVLQSLTMGQWAIAAEAEPETHKVSIDATSYAPTTKFVNVGDTVVWTNDDLFIHTVTSKEGGFDSGNIAPGATWKFTPKEKGEFAYSCIYHAAMKGKLVVR